MGRGIMSWHGNDHNLVYQCLGISSIPLMWHHLKMIVSIYQIRNAKKILETTRHYKQSCMEQLWGRLFLLLSQKLRCNTWRNAPLQLVDTRYIALVTIRWTKLTLNEQFTKESEENGELPFLDCLVNRNNNELRTTVFRKPTPTDRLLDESS